MSILFSLILTTTKTKFHFIVSPVLKLFEIVDNKPRKVFFPSMVWRAELAFNRKNVQYETIPVTFAENTVYFKRFREKGETLEELGGDQAQNYKELKDSLELIRTALRSSEWVAGSERE
ncbi:hypothetical protein BGZ46_003544 [Entomortierella lignicola]|nr:hypothetical protein BGZ46_003544 [Entomortierella lignicola]